MSATETAEQQVADGTAETTITGFNIPEPTAPAPVQVAPLTRQTIVPAGVAILGYTVSWSTSSLLVDRETLVTAMTECGFKGSIPKRPPTARRALRRAIYEWAGNRTGEAIFDEDDLRDANGRKRLIREIKSSNRERGVLPPVMYALVEELNLGSRLGLQYATAYRFRYDPSATVTESDEGQNVGQLTVLASAYAPGIEAERARVLAEITPLWEKHKSLYNGLDLSNILIEIVRANLGVSVESGSGVWYLPVGKADVVDRLEQLIATFRANPGAGSAHCRVHENIDWPRTRESLAQAAMDDLLAEIRQQEMVMAGYEADNKARPGSVKQTTMAGLVKNLIGLQEKAVVYRETVGLRDTRIEKELVAVGARAVALTKENRQLRQDRAETGAGNPVVMEREVREERR